MMTVLCGVCGGFCNDENPFTKCSGNCGRTFHVTCVKTVKTRAGNKWTCEDCSNKKDSSASSNKSNSSTTALTKEFMISVLEEFKKEVFLELKAHSTRLEEFNTTVEFISNKIDTSNVLMADIRKEYAEIRKEQKELRLKNEELTETVADLKVRVRELEQYSRKTNIEISGIPASGKEDITSLLKDVGAVIGQELLEGQVTAAHRVPSFNRQRPPSLVVQFQSRIQRDAWLTSFKQKKTLSANEVNRAFPSNRVYISEHLSPDNKRFLSQLKQQCKEAGVKFVWFRDGKFYVRKCEGEKCHKISKMDDLKNVCK